MDGRRIFLSYGHDEYAALAEQLKSDLEEDGYQIWFDLARLKHGGDWERYIEEGLEWVSEVPGQGRLLLLMTPHSVRRPNGYCLNELARAIARNLVIIPAMVNWCEPPLSICRLQYLDMQDCWPFEDRQESYQKKYTLLKMALEAGQLECEGVHARLLQRLDPLPFDAEIARHRQRFTGREWVLEKLDSWLANPGASRVFWITGNPGVGKTALSARLLDRREVVAFHLCRHGNTQKSDPRRLLQSVAFQLSVQLPDYQMRLNALPLEQILAADDARTMCDRLLSQPLAGNFPAPAQPLVILIDALDEAGDKQHNALATLLATELDYFPPWLRLIITSRPEPEVRRSLQRYDPYVLNAATTQNLDDLRTYLHRELRPFYRDRKVPSAVIEAVVSKSEGLFLYADWIRQELADGHLTLDRVKDFPQGIGAIYLQFFFRQFPDAEAYDQECRPVLEVLAAAHEPLPPDYLADMFNWTPRQTQKIMDTLGSLFPLRLGRVQPFHLSVLDWLTNLEKAGDYGIEVRAGHRRFVDWGWAAYHRGLEYMPLYALVHLPAHLAASGQEEEIRTLLWDCRWLQSKLGSAGVNALIQDYDLYHGDQNLPLIQGALRLSANVLLQDKEQLASQLLGRLLAFKTIPIQLFCKRLIENQNLKNRSWLRPLTQSLMAPGQPLGQDLTDHSKEVIAIAMVEDGANAVSVSSDETISVWNLKTGLQVSTIDSHRTYGVNAVAFTPDFKVAVLAMLNKSLKVWNMEIGQEMGVINDHISGVNSVAVTSDGKLAVSGAFDKTIKVWDLETCKELFCLIGHTESVNALAVTPDGKIAVSGAGDQRIKIWDLSTGVEKYTLRGHTDSVWAVAVTHNGRLAVSGSGDRTLKVWDLDMGKNINSLFGHSGGIWAVAVTLDGQLAVSGSGDNTLKVWDLDTGACLATFTGDSTITACAAAPDGRTFVAGEVSGRVHFLRLEGSKLF